MVFCLNELIKRKYFYVFFILIKRVLILKMIKREIMRDRISMLLKAKQRGSEVLMPGALWFRRSVRSSGLIHSKVLQETLEGKHRSYGLLYAELLSVRTVRKS